MNRFDPCGSQPAPFGHAGHAIPSLVDVGGMALCVSNPYDLWNGFGKSLKTGGARLVCALPLGVSCGKARCQRCGHDGQHYARVMTKNLDSIWCPEMVRRPCRTGQDCCCREPESLLTSLFAIELCNGDPGR